jgi:hypothetical protein
LSERQCAQLRKRWTGKTTDEAWKCIWSIIFPHLEPPQSIYAEDLPTAIQPDQVSGFLSEFQRWAPAMLQQILIERSSETMSNEISSWLLSADAQSILSASIEELLNRLPCTENSQPTLPTAPIPTTNYFFSEVPDFSGLLNFDLFDGALTKPASVHREESICNSVDPSAGPLKEIPESLESVLNRTYSIDEKSPIPKLSDASFVGTVDASDGIENTCDPRELFADGIVVGYLERPPGGGQELPVWHPR